MSIKIKNVIILGAGGNLGPSILEALDLDPQFTVSIASRKGSSTKFPAHIKVHQIDDDYPEDQLRAAFQGQDAVVNLVPPFLDIQIHKTIIDASISAGVKRIIPSEFSDDRSAYEIFMEKTAMFQLKRDVENYLRSKEDTGLSWSSIINGGFFDWGLTSGFLGFDLPSRSATIYDQGSHRGNFTLLSTVSAAVLSVLKHLPLTANKQVHINSYRATQREILAALENATTTAGGGGQQQKEKEKKWTVTTLSTEAVRKDALTRLDKDHADLGATQGAILSSFYGGDPAADYAERGLVMNGALGLPGVEPLEVVVGKIVRGEKV